ncbi:MAG: chemotaxis protein CheW [Actinomycetota bacterium]|nr:chemotaxis protein CheW [Actinomycetota bacterium]
MSDSQYVTFELAGQNYGVDVGDAVEVIRMVAMADPPEAPPYVIGVINIRGQVVPVIDMRRRLALESANFTLTTPILVSKIRNRTIGLIVDRVKEVVTLPSAMIEPPSEAFSRSRCVAGVAKIDAKLIFLLDLAGLFSNNEARLFEELLSSDPVENKALV